MKIVFTQYRDAEAIAAYVTRTRKELYTVNTLPGYPVEYEVIPATEYRPVEVSQQVAQHLSDVEACLVNAGRLPKYNPRLLPVIKRAVGIDSDVIDFLISDGVADEYGIEWEVEFYIERRW